MINLSNLIKHYHHFLPTLAVGEVGVDAGHERAGHLHHLRQGRQVGAAAVAPIRVELLGAAGARKDLRREEEVQHQVGGEGRQVLVHRLQTAHRRGRGGGGAGGGGGDISQVKVL